MGCEQGLNGCEKFAADDSNPGVIPVQTGLMPKLFLPWNTSNPAEERCFSWFVHTMKKKIL
jgi:hypothetical protein